MYETNLKESILRTLGARGMSMNSELVKNDILRRASRLVGTSIADSFTVKRRYSRLICKQVKLVCLVGDKKPNKNLLLLLVLPIALKLVEGKQLQALCQCPQKVAFLVPSPCYHDQIQQALCKRHKGKKDSKKIVTSFYAKHVNH
jgi:hypothetical protein